METKGCTGYQLAGVASGLKKNNNKDLGLIYSEVPASVAGIFTRNKIQAAPVQLDKKRISSGSCQAIIANSGNANCCTGDQGMQDAIHMTRLAAIGLEISEDLVLVSSTGVIGQLLEIEKIEAAMPELLDALDADGFTAFAEAIMTTDTVPKIVTRQGEIDGQTFTITAMAKGAGMIRPDMATMLCYVLSDVEAAPDQLNRVLKPAADRSLNRLTIDGDTSTNDTTIIMANGQSGAKISSDDHLARFHSLLVEVLIDISRQLVRDGEGVSKLVDIIVKGASTDDDALRIADTVAHSPLLKTAFFGEDANWGRIFMAVGRAGAEINPDTIDVFFDDVQMVKDSFGCGDRAEKEATEVLKQPEFKVTIDLKIGDGHASMLTCDFSVDYVKINADYRS